MKSLWGIARPTGLGVLIGLLVSGLILLAGSRPRGQAIRLVPPPSPSPIIVHVSGAVARPGVYSLPQGSRIQDAIQAAGRALPAADLEALNLAAPLQDGQRVDVPVKGASPAVSGPPASGAIPSGNTVNINNATLEELASLPGIGLTLAGRILEYRQAHGAFATIEAIQSVDGIGEGKFEQIKDLISVGP